MRILNLENKSYYIYVTGPIDWFPATVSYKEVYPTFTGHQLEEDFTGAAERQDELINRLIDLAGEIDGDTHPQLRQEVLAFALPTKDYDCEVGYILKLNNNGTTIVCSPFRLPWME